jgi:hypothetical protein
MHLTEQMPSLLSNNEKVKDPATVANAFNNFFLTTTEILNLHQAGSKDAVLFLKAEFSIKFPGIKIISTTETEIKNIIHSLTSKNSSGCDEITSKILLACWALISRPLAHICNHSLYTGIFLDHLKISVVRPLYRKGDKISVTNYRPISLFATVMMRGWPEENHPTGDTNCYNACRTAP